MGQTHLDCKEFYERATKLADVALRLALESGADIEDRQNYKETMKRILWRQMERVYKSGC